MRIEISLTSAHRDEDVRRAARWMVERTAAARRAGLDSLLLRDHHAAAAPSLSRLARVLAALSDV